MLKHDFLKFACPSCMMDDRSIQTESNTTMMTFLKLSGSDRRSPLTWESHKTTYLSIWVMPALSLTASILLNSCPLLQLINVLTIKTLLCVCVRKWGNTPYRVTQCSTTKRTKLVLRLCQFERTVHSPY